MMRTRAWCVLNERLDFLMCSKNRIPGGFVLVCVVSGYEIEPMDEEQQAENTRTAKIS